MFSRGLGSKVDQNTTLFIKENAFQYVVCEMDDILFVPHFIDWHLVLFMQFLWFSHFGCIQFCSLINQEHRSDSLPGISCWWIHLQFLIPLYHILIRTIGARECRGKYHLDRFQTIHCSGVCHTRNWSRLYATYKCVHFLERYFVQCRRWHRHWNFVLNSLTLKDHVYLLF